MTDTTMQEKSGLAQGRRVEGNCLEASMCDKEESIPSINTRQEKIISPRESSGE